MAQITSAFESLYAWRVEIAVDWSLHMIVTCAREGSGFTFAIPTYFFVVSMFITVGWAFTAMLPVRLERCESPAFSLEGARLQSTPWLLLHAFSNGTSALTGIEAISNGITAFNEPRAKNAGITLIWMSSILAVLFLGVSFLSAHIKAVPSELETVISQMARTIYGGVGILYLAVIAGTSSY